MGPEGHLTDVHSDVVPVGVEVRLARMGVDDQAGVSTRCPEAVVVVGAVGGEVVPHGRHHDALDAGLAGKGLDLLDGLINIVNHRDEGHAGTADRVGSAELL